MRFARAAGIVLATAMVWGCQAKKPVVMAPPPPPMADESTARMMQENFKQIDPGAQVGLVMAVKTEDRLAAVGNVDTKLFHEGDAVTFIDSEKHDGVSGRVVNIAEGFVDVKYEPPTAKKRAPHKGDLAVRFSH